jgi:hypothetical protein
MGCELVSTRHGLVGRVLFAEKIGINNAGDKKSRTSLIQTHFYIVIECNHPIRSQLFWEKNDLRHHGGQR